MLAPLPQRVFSANLISPAGWIVTLSGRSAGGHFSWP